MYVNFSAAHLYTLETMSGPKTKTGLVQDISRADRSEIGSAPVRPNILAAVALLFALGTSLGAAAAEQKLRVCIWPDYHSITYRNPKSGELGGLDIALSQRFAARMGFEIEYVNSSFPGLVPDLLNSRCDVGMFGIAAIPERKAHLLFSKPYLRGEIIAATTKQNSRITTWSDIDTAGTVIAVQAGTYMEPVMRRSLNRAELKIVSPPATRENEIRSGRADAFMTDFPYAKRLLENEDWIRIVQPATPFYPIDYAYAVAPLRADLRERLDEFVVEMRANGVLRNLATRYGLESMVPKDWNDE